MRERPFCKVGVRLWGWWRRGDWLGGVFRLALDMAGGFPGGEDFVVAFVDLAEDGVEGFDGALAGAEGGGDGGGSWDWLDWKLCRRGCASDSRNQNPETRQEFDSNSTTFSFQGI